MLPELPAEQVRQAVESLAAETLADAGLRRPPIDAVQLALRIGLVVARENRTVRETAAAAPRARFVNLAVPHGESLPTILVADDPRSERRHWAVAHEIGEFCAHEVFQRLGVEPRCAPPAAREQIANQLAACLLLPRSSFAQRGRNCDWDLLELKEVFTTASHELIARRMLAMPPTIVVTLFDQGKLVWRTGNLDRRAPALTAAEKTAWQFAHAHGQPTRCDQRELPDGIVDVRAWPIHEENWRREIVRTELTMDD